MCCYKQDSVENAASLEDIQQIVKTDISWFINQHQIIQDDKERDTLI